MSAALRELVERACSVLEANTDKSYRRHVARVIRRELAAMLPMDEARAAAVATSRELYARRELGTDLEEAQALSAWMRAVEALIAQDAIAAAAKRQADEDHTIGSE